MSFFLNSIEPTVEPVEAAGRLVHDGAGRLFVSDPTIRSSAEEEEADMQRLGFGNVFGLKLALRIRIKLVTTVFVTATSTSVHYVTVGRKTFFIQICTPSPFRCLRPSRTLDEC